MRASYSDNTGAIPYKFIRNGANTSNPETQKLKDFEASLLETKPKDAASFNSGRQQLLREKHEQQLLAKAQIKAPTT